MAEVIKEPALGISIQCQAGTTGIVFQTFVEKDAGLKEINGLLDRVTKAAARQQAKVDLVELEKNLKVNMDQLVRMREDRARIEARSAAPQEGRRNQTRAPVLNEQQREQADANDKRLGEIIGDMIKQIDDTKAVIADEG